VTINIRKKEGGIVCNIKRRGVAGNLKGEGMRQRVILSGDGGGAAGILFV